MGSLRRIRQAAVAKGVQSPDGKKNLPSVDGRKVSLEEFQRHLAMSPPSDQEDLLEETDSACAEQAAGLEDMSWEEFRRHLAMSPPSDQEDLSEETDSACAEPQKAPAVVTKGVQSPDGKKNSGAASHM